MLNWKQDFVGTMTLFTNDIAPTLIIITKDNQTDIGNSEQMDDSFDASATSSPWLSCGLIYKTSYVELRKNSVLGKTYAKNAIYKEA